jgi:nucleotide-binding universal stress UspA family protein
MFRTLVVPLDGSEQAEGALPYAVRLALASGGELVLVRAVVARLATGFDWERQQLQAVEEAETYLASVAAEVGRRVPAKMVAPYGETPVKLLETVTLYAADAIVMTTHGRTGLDHLLQGSVAEAVLAHSPVPVLLVHARSSDALPPVFDPANARVLVPLDGSALAEAALHAAVELSGASGELVLTTVAGPPDHVSRDDHGRARAYLEREAQAYLRNVDAQLKQRYPDVRTVVDVRIGDPASGIGMVALDRGADVVVMSTRGRTGIGRALMGSVAGEVLRAGRLPVVLVGPGAAVAEARSYHRAQ